MKNARPKSAIAVSVACALVLLAAGPAAAVTNRYYPCVVSSAPWLAQLATGTAVSKETTTAALCGTFGVRSHYTVPGAGGSSFWTSWSYADHFVQSAPGYTLNASEHRTSYHAVVALP